MLKFMDSWEKEDNMQNDFSRITHEIERQLGEIVSTEKLPSRQNNISRIETPKGNFVVKVYEQRRPKANPNREIQMSRILRDLPEIREMIYCDESKKLIPHDFAIFRYAEGETLRACLETDSLTGKQIENIAAQVHDLISSIVQIPTQGFGRLDDTGMRGTSVSWVQFLRDSQSPMIETFRTHDVIPSALYLSATRMLDARKDKFDCDSPKLLPMDLNIGNIVVGSDDKIKFIDLKTFWSGDSLCAFSQFYALTNGTHLGKSFINHVEGFQTDQFKVRFYALLDNLNVLAFIARSDPEAAREARPWGNPKRFVDLIEEHIACLEAL